MKLVYNENALSALRLIYGFIANKSERSAAKTVRKIIDRTNLLLSFPEMAPVELTLDEPEVMRALTVKPYYKVIITSPARS